MSAWPSLHLSLCLRRTWKLGLKLTYLHAPLNSSAFEVLSYVIPHVELLALGLRFKPFGPNINVQSLHSFVTYGYSSLFIRIF